jgi:hypothetical protein
LLLVSGVGVGAAAAGGVAAGGFGLGAEAGGVDAAGGGLLLLLLGQPGAPGSSVLHTVLPTTSVTAPRICPSSRFPSAASSLRQGPGDGRRMVR